MFSGCWTAPFLERSSTRLFFENDHVYLLRAIVSIFITTLWSFLFSDFFQKESYVISLGSCVSIMQVELLTQTHASGAYLLAATWGKSTPGCLILKRTCFSKTVALWIDNRPHLFCGYKPSVFTKPELVDDGFVLVDGDLLEVNVRWVRYCHNGVAVLVNPRGCFFRSLCYDLYAAYLFALNGTGVASNFVFGVWQP